MHLGRIPSLQRRSVERYKQLQNDVVNAIIVCMFFITNIMHFDSECLLILIVLQWKVTRVSDVTCKEIIKHVVSYSLQVIPWYVSYVS